MMFRVLAALTLALAPTATAMSSGDAGASTVEEESRGLRAGGCGTIVINLDGCNTQWLDASQLGLNLIEVVGTGTGKEKKNGDYEFTCSGTIPFGTSNAAGQIFALPEQVCGFPILGPAVCPNGLDGDIIFTAATTGFLCYCGKFGTGISTADYQTTIDPVTGDWTITCNFPAPDDGSGNNGNPGGC